MHVTAIRMYVHANRKAIVHMPRKIIIHINVLICIRICAGVSYSNNSTNRGVVSVLDGVFLFRWHYLVCLFFLIFYVYEHF